MTYKSLLVFCAAALAAAITTALLIRYAPRVLDSHSTRCAELLQLPVKSNSIATIQQSDEGGWRWTLRVKSITKQDSFLVVREFYPPLVGKTLPLFVRAGKVEQVFQSEARVTPTVIIDSVSSHALLEQDDLHQVVTMQWPLKGNFEVIQFRGQSVGRITHTVESGIHQAIDILAPIGTPVFAGRGGVVVQAEHRYPDWGCDLPELANRGNVVVILHDDGTEATYGHLRKNSLQVSVGDSVSAGQKIGEVGNSGKSVLPHLHLHVGGIYVPAAGYRTVPINFSGCGRSGAWVPVLGEVKCEVQ